MATGNVAPIIIKKKKVVAGGGHHGGAWKVAYADFVTAMMAFFLLMWLLNATTEEQRSGIADYFSPTIPIHRMSGGGSASLGGESVLAENTLAKSGTGASGKNPPWIKAVDSANSQGSGPEGAKDMLKEVNATLIGGGGESQLMENELRHIVSRVTDEGVVIEVFDVAGSPLFTDDERATPVLKKILDRIAIIADSVESPLAVTGHTKTQPIVRASVDLWSSSVSRSLEVGRELQFSGVDKERFKRITGRSNTELFEADPLSPRNNRVEITFLLDDSAN